MHAKQVYVMSQGPKPWSFTPSDAFLTKTQQAPGPALPHCDAAGYAIAACSSPAPAGGAASAATVAARAEQQQTASAKQQECSGVAIGAGKGHYLRASKVSQLIAEITLDVSSKVTRLGEEG